MKNIKYIIGGLVLGGALAFTSCSDFDDVNADPKAATKDQVLSEYLINKSLVAAQLNPHIAERAFVLYWKTAGHQQRSGGISTGSLNDGWSVDYYNHITTNCLKPIYEAIKLSKIKIDEKKNKSYEPTLYAVARIWRAYLLTEASDMFGPVAIEGYAGENPHYATTEDVYKYALKELKEASEILKTSETPKDTKVTDLDHIFGYNTQKWFAYSNSLRMRLAMRLSEVAKDLAQTNFEEAAAAGGILTADGRFQFEEKPGWDDLTGVMSREWNAQFISPTYNNLVLGLGGIKSEQLIKNNDIKKMIKPANYMGMKYDKHFTLKSSDPSCGFFFDGIPYSVDPRTYNTFIIPGDVDNPEFCFYPSWAKEETYKTKYDLKRLDDKTKTLDSLDAKFTWNVWPAGDWGEVGAVNDMIQLGTMPRLAQKFRGSKNKRVFLGEWETYFLIAEAALRGWKVPMDAKTAYEDGIKASFAYSGAEFIDEYLKSTAYNRVGTSVAWDHTAEPPATVEMDCINGYTKKAEKYTYKYPIASNTLYGKALNDHLTKIITQKFIANTPWLPLETWNDHRRLGLPFFETPAVEKPLVNMPQLNKSNFMKEQVNFFPQRLKFPSSIEVGNKPGYIEAVKQLGGEDNVFTPLWWAKKK